MATDHPAPTLHLVQPRRALTNAERQKAWRDRQKSKKSHRVLIADGAEKGSVAPSALLAGFGPDLPKTAPTGDMAAAVPFTGAAGGSRADAPLRITPAAKKWTKRPFEMSTFVLRAVSVALAGVGLSMNAVYAHSLGSTDVSGWLFLALGVAADAAALVLPSVAASAPARVQRVAGWAAFAAVFAFAILASVGFASTSISDVTTARNGRVTPAVTAAQAALADAQGARDRECKGGVGKFCREREASVASARQNLEQAMLGVARDADPQAAALVHVVSWVSRGAVTPSEGDVGMLRLILFALLPQIGGILLMVSRRP